MRHRDCPGWLRGSAFLTRWKIYKCPVFQRFQTRAWLAWMAKGWKFGVFKIPHALTKVIPLQDIVPNIHFILLIRHPYAQIASAIATDNPLEYLKETADALIKLYQEQYSSIRNITVARYEDIIDEPNKEFKRICDAIGLDSSDEVIDNCIDLVGVKKGQYSNEIEIPDYMQKRAMKLCEIQDYLVP